MTLMAMLTENTVRRGIVSCALYVKRGTWCGKDTHLKKYKVVGFNHILHFRYVNKFQI